MKLQAKEAALKALIVLVPSYLAAYLTEKMVWVVPTLAAAGFFASSVSLLEASTRRRLDDDQDADESEDHEPTVQKEVTQEISESSIQNDGGFE